MLDFVTSILPSYKAGGRIRLHVLFPTTPVARFREVVLALEHSFLFQAVEQLLSDTKAAELQCSILPTASSWFFLGRRGTAAPKDSPRPELPTLTPHDLLPSPEFTNAVISHLRQTFPSVPLSAARSLVADGRTLAATYELFATYKNRQSRFSNWLSGVFPSSSSSSSSPPTPLPVSDELDAEIYAFRSPERAAQAQEDARLARELNHGWTEVNLLHTCGCCFDDVAFEDLGCCSSGDHVFCITCIIRQVEEHVFGGAPLSPAPPDDGMTRYDRSGVRCLSTEGCHATFSFAELERILPPTLSATLSRRVADAALDEMLADQAQKGEAHEIVVRCPFCPYCELEDTAILKRAFPILGRRTTDVFLKFCWSLYSFAALAIFTPLYILVFFGISMTPQLFTEFIPTTSSGPTSTPADDHIAVFPLLEPHLVFGMAHRFIASAGKRVLARRAGRRNVFVCRNGPNGLPLPEFGVEASSASSHVDLVRRVWGGYATKRDESLPGNCGKLSCLTCQKVYVPGAHQCYDEQEGLRLAIEKAMSEAVKRTCPACGVAFQKSSGCNKVRSLPSVLDAGLTCLGGIRLHVAVALFNATTVENRLLRQKVTHISVTIFECVLFFQAAIYFLLIDDSIHLIGSR